MKLKFEPSVSMGNIMILAGCLISASVVWGTTKEQMMNSRRDIDKLQVTSDHYGELIQEIQKTQAATAANETMILEWLKRLPQYPSPLHSPRQEDR